MKLLLRITLTAFVLAGWAAVLVPAAIWFWFGVGGMP
jgi:hypothetical protein